MTLIDALNQAETITLPGFGTIRVGELPDGLDVTSLQEQLRRFYGDRFRVVQSHPPPPAISHPIVPATKPPRRRRS